MQLAMYGALSALASAVLFGAATPAAKALLARLTVFQLAGLLYLGAAIGIAPRALWRYGDRPPLDAITRRRLAGAVLFGGIAGPVLLLLGLRSATAGSVSLLLNVEVAATVLLGTLVFGEALGARGWFGVGGVVAAGTMLSWGGGWPGVLSALFVAAACTCWGLDNNFTAHIDTMSPSETTLWKTAIAGTTNLLIGVALAPITAPATTIAVALGVGAVCYGVSIALYITAAHERGAIRAQSIFAAAPFVGAILSWAVLHEPIEGVQVVAAVFFVGALALLTFDRHSHAHAHEPLSHTHSHRHDDGHHDHDHVDRPAEGRHTHWHDHGATAHAHPHVADLHHRHGSR
jgi:drug/metabolite transporter (DMT)-like permease